VTSELVKRGRKRKLDEQACNAVEAFQNANFDLGQVAPGRIARTQLGIQVSDQRASQAMVAHGVKLYVAAQAKALNKKQRKLRVDHFKPLIGKPLRYWKGKVYCDESHYGFGPDARRRIHRRTGADHRTAPNKVHVRGTP